ncbi:type II secretion system protein [bacterium]|nr:type II secretion system protein [bacterium]
MEKRNYLCPLGKIKKMLKQVQHDREQSCHYESERSEDVVIPCKFCKVLRLRRSFHSLAMTGVNVNTLALRERVSEGQERGQSGLPRRCLGFAPRNDSTVIASTNDSECVAIQKNSYKNDWIASSDLRPTRNDRRINNCKELIHLITYSPIHFKKIAFTLAEILITIGIIGVVAALTIPGLSNNYKARRLHTQFLKSYSTIQQAFKQMEADDVSLDPSTYDASGFYKEVMKFINAPFDCQDNLGNRKFYLPCYSYQYNKTDNAPPYKSFDGDKDINGNYFDDGQIAMQDGSLILFENPHSGQDVWVSVDLNGYNNLPNRWGYDLFTFQFVEGEIKVMGEKGTNYTDLNKYCDKNSSNALNGVACAYKAKNDPDYFKSVVKDFK